MACSQKMDDQNSVMDLSPCKLIFMKWYPWEPLLQGMRPNCDNHTQCNFQVTCILSDKWQKCSNCNRIKTTSFGHFKAMFLLPNFPLLFNFMNKSSWQHIHYLLAVNNWAKADSQQSGSSKWVPGLELINELSPQLHSQDACVPLVKAEFVSLSSVREPLCAPR